MNEPDKKELAKMAYDSAKEYYRTRPHTRVEFETYQRSFVGTYRREYANREIASLEKA
jgi:hypothetical protein